MQLPRKDKDGNQYLSYSAISCFKKDEADFYDRYIANKPFQGNAYTDFGSKVGEALEHNDFSKFEESEQNILKQVERLDQFETKIKLQYDNFYVMGFIDTNKADYSKIIDYKTGGRDKEHQYKSEHYNQLDIYALALRQTYGITPECAQVHFIRRDGNAFQGEELTIANEKPTVIDIDISLERITRVYYEVIKTAEKISQFYLKHK